MKIILSALALTLLVIAPVSAADPSAILEQAVKDTQARKMVAAAKIIVLEGDQKSEFDSLYAEFQDALGAVNEKYADLGYSLLGKSAVPSVEEVQRIIREFRDLEVKRLDLKDYYFEKFGKILGPAQLIRLFQLENKADAILRHAAATQIPFLE